MACTHSNRKKITIKVPSYEIRAKVTYYKIEMKLGGICWSVTYRYNDFVELHDMLVNEHGLARDLLPPKHFFTNIYVTAAFLSKRKFKLEEYLLSALDALSKPLPHCLTKFLLLDKHDINILLQDLALFFYQQGYNRYRKGDGTSYSFNPLQVRSMFSF